MMNNVLLWVVLWLLQKLADAVADKVLERVLRDENLRNLSLALKFQVLVLCLDWLFKRTPVQEVAKRLENASKGEE